jgi:isopropylmalate/homocitrate/citramalate synthase
MDPFATHPDVLEVTLRDGSYLIDFQFTAHDTVMIAGALEAVGFRWIEVGHGVGMNASASGHGVAGATDEEYLDAAASTLTRARWGMFFIPGIGREQDLRLAARYGMSFVRIGTNINEVALAEPFIKQAKDLGMLVSYNGMKSYAVSAEDWGRYAAQAHSFGADIACLVDSAGSMYPE